MSDELFPYFDSELAYLRQLGDEFAREHPAAAWALRLGENNNDAHRDPHVERMLQGVAFLNARIRHRLDDDFPELAESLLNTLYPQYLAPFPSCAIAEMAMDLSQVGPDAASGRLIPKGSAVEFNQTSSSGAPLQYRTAYPVQLLPIRVSSVTFRNDRFESPEGSRPREAEAALQIELETVSSEISFESIGQMLAHESELQQDADKLTIRFFLHGQLRTVHAIYDQLLKSTLRVVCYDKNSPQTAVCLPSTTLSAVGFQPNENLLPADGRVLPGYRLLHEFFAFPQKFHFVDITIPRARLTGIGQRLQLLFMTRDENEDLAAMITRDSVRLGCSPLVNLFDARTAFARNYREAEHRLIVDERFPLDHEIFSVKRVAVTTAGRPEQEYRSFYDIYHAPGRQVAGFWHSHRRQSTRNSSGAESGTEVYLSLVDHAIRPDVMDDATVSIDLVCMNRNQLDRARGSGSDSLPSLLLTEGDFNATAALVTRPTPMQRRTLRSDWRWRLCSHLALNHLSLTDRADGTDGFREILRLYNVSDAPALMEKIEGLVSLATSPNRITRRVAPGPHGFARGMEVTMTFREAAYADGGLFLFASVLNAFLSNYCTINSFVETVIRSAERNREFHRWSALSGTRPLL